MEHGLSLPQKPLAAQPQVPPPRRSSRCSEMGGCSGGERILQQFSSAECFNTRKRPGPDISHLEKAGPQTQVGTARCAVPAASSGGAACVVPGSGAMPRRERSAPERRGDAAARRPYRRAECEVSGRAVQHAAPKAVCGTGLKVICIESHLHCIRSETGPLSWSLCCQVC